MQEPVERFIPTADVRERHETIVSAPAELVFDVARGFRLTVDSIVRAI